MPTYNIGFDSLTEARDNFDWFGATGINGIDSTNLNQRFRLLGTGTPSSGVGPNGPFSGTNYVFFEASGSGVNGSEAYAVWKPKPGEQVDSLSFRYNKRGSSMGDLRIEYLDDDGWQTVWENLGPDVPTNGTPVWRAASTLFPGEIQQFRIVWRMPAPGTVWNSDMGVDALVVQTSALVERLIDGTIASAADNSPVSGETVVLLREANGGMEESDRTVTDASGYFAFTVFNSTGYSIHVGPLYTLTGVPISLGLN